MDIFRELDEVNSEFMISMRKRYLARNSERLSGLKQAIDDLVQQPSRCERLYEVFRVFHTLAGSAGSYGFEGAKLICSQAEVILKDLHDRGVEVPPSVVDFLQQTLSTLIHYFSEATPKNFNPDFTLPVLPVLGSK